MSDNTKYPKTCLMCKYNNNEDTDLVRGRLKRHISAEKCSGRNSNEYLCWTEVLLCPVCGSVHWCQELFRDTESQGHLMEELDDLTKLYNQLRNQS